MGGKPKTVPVFVPAPTPAVQAERPVAQRTGAGAQRRRQTNAARANVLLSAEGPDGGFRNVLGGG